MAKKGFDMMELMNGASKKNAAGAARYELQNIPLEKMIPNPANEKIYEVGDIEELAESILLTGKILQNAVVTAADKKGNYTIIAGHRRRLACQKLVEEGHKEFAEMPCMVMAEPDTLMQELVLIQTNSTARVLSEAEKMRQAERATAILTELKNRKQISGRVRDIVAKMLGTTTGQLGRYNVISKGLTNETLRAAFEQGKMGISAAYEAARLDEAGQAELAAKMEAGAGGVPSARDAVEQRKKDEIARAADEAESGLPMRKEYKADIKKKYKASLTVEYEERDGKFYAGINYDTKNGGGATPIDKKTPYETAQEAIEGGIKRAAQLSRQMHDALWGSGYVLVGEPVEPTPIKEKTEWLSLRENGKATIDGRIITEKADGEYKTKVVYRRYGEDNKPIYIGSYPNLHSARAAAIEYMARNAEEYFVKAMLEKGLIDEMPERFKKDDAPEEKTKNYYEEEEFIATHPKTAAAMQKMNREGYDALTPCEKCKAATRCEECCRTCPPEKHCNARQCFKGELPTNEQAGEPEKREKEYDHKEEAAIQIKAIEGVLAKLKKNKEHQEQAAEICEEAKDEKGEAIARAAVDFYDELIDYAEQEIDNIGNSL